MPPKPHRYDVVHRDFALESLDSTCSGRDAFVKGLVADFAALRDDPKAWAEELSERELWDATTPDGLEGE